MAWALFIFCGFKVKGLGFRFWGLKISGSGAMPRPGTFQGPGLVLPVGLRVRISVLGLNAKHVLLQFPEGGWDM